MRGVSFSLFGLVLIVEAGKLPGIFSAPEMEGRTERTLAWPAEGPKEGEALSNLIVWSLRNVNVPVVVALTELELAVAVSLSGDWERKGCADRSG